MTKKEDILKQAQKIVEKRGNSYGTPYDNFTRIADLWSVHLEKDISVYDVGAMLILLKLARSKEDMQNDDTWIDIAGYAGATSEAILHTTKVDLAMRNFLGKIERKSRATNNKG